MEKVAIEDVDPRPPGGERDRRPLSEALGTTDVAINRYRIPPGSGLPGGVHAHADQEEVFVVEEGTATFETMDGEIAVAEGEAVRFAPGEFQSGWNDGERDLVVLALGAPRETADVRVPIACPDCDHETLRLDFGGDDLAFACPACGATRSPGECPECGHDDLRVSLTDEGDSVVVCRGCGAAFETPPVRGRW